MLQTYCTLKMYCNDFGNIKISVQDACLKKYIYNYVHLVSDVSLYFMLRPDTGTCYKNVFVNNIYNTNVYYSYELQ